MTKMAMLIMIVRYLVPTSNLVFIFTVMMGYLTINTALWFVFPAIIWASLTMLLVLMLSVFVHYSDPDALLMVKNDIKYDPDINEKAKVGDLFSPAKARAVLFSIPNLINLATGAFMISSGFIIYGTIIASTGLMENLVYSCMWKIHKE